MRTACGKAYYNEIDPDAAAWLDAGLSQAEIATALETFPLVSGQPARAMLLRGYGNSVTVPLAAEFIRACMEYRR